MNEDKKHKRNLLQDHKKRLQALERKAALYGIDIPPHIQVEIESIKDTIVQLEKSLRRKEITRPRREIATDTIPEDVWDWESYGKEGVAWLAKRLNKRVEDIRADGWEEVDWTLASNKYRDEMQRLYGSIQIFGMTNPVPLTNIFTDIYLLDKPSAWRRYAIEELRTRGQMALDESDQDQRYNGADLMQSEKRLFILGQPGAGKTTFLKYLVMQATAKVLKSIPIFVSLKAWSDTNYDLPQFLMRQFKLCGLPDPRPLVEHILEEGRAIILFDGLDEVNLEGNARANVTIMIREYAQRYNRCRMVITCRTAATDYMFEQFRYCELAHFTQKQIEAFVTQWFQDDITKREEFLKAFGQEEYKGLRDLARRPLLLTMLCLTFEETMAFPRRRAELYEEAIDALLKKWDTARSIQRDTIYRKLSLGYKRQLLMDIAAETFEHGEFLMHKVYVVERTTRFLRRLPPMDINEDIDGETVLRAIEAQHGLLVERAHDIYSFSHLTFHEYFTARYVADHPEASVLQGAILHAADPQWREVLLLTASMLDYRNIELLFRIWCQFLKEQAESNEALQSIIVSLIDSDEASIPSNTSIRAAALIRMLLEQALINVLRLIPEFSILSNRITLLNSLPQVYPDFSPTNPQLFTRLNDLASMLGNASKTGIEFDLDNAQLLAHEIAKELSVTRMRGVDIQELNVARDRALNLASILNLASVVARIHERCIHYGMSQLSLVTQIDDKCNKSQDWQLITTRLERLSDYILGTYRLLECLDVATVENRGAILDQLLTIPTQPTISAPL